MKSRIKVVLIGLGEIGGLIGKTLLEKEGFHLAGAADISSNLNGRDVGEVLGIKKKLGVTVTSDTRELISDVTPDLAIIATTSSFNKVYPIAELCVREKVNVISTCEELVYPFDKYPTLSRRLNDLAIKNGVAVLGTGINPGYLMDSLPIFLTHACNKVESISVSRVIDSSKRRIAFQKKIGTGLSVSRFKRMVESGQLRGHVGLHESIALVASALGWKLQKIIEEGPEPVTANEDLSTGYLKIKKGYVAGLMQKAYGVSDGRRVILLEFLAYAGAKEEYDSIEIEAIPRIRQRILGGINGDLGTAAIVVNMIPKLMNSKPGLHTMKDFWY